MSKIIVHAPGIPPNTVFDKCDNCNLIGETTEGCYRCNTAKEKGYEKCPECNYFSDDITKYHNRGCPD